MIPDPLKDWYADESKRVELEQALRLPIVQEAMSLLRHICVPKTDFSGRSSAEAIAHAAMEQNRTAGLFSYEDELWQLTELPKEPPKPPEGYSEAHVLAWARKHGMWETFGPAEQTN